jgi:hypothetical protein
LATATTARRTARKAGRKAANSDGVQRLARLGLAGRGFLYVTVAVLAANIARGSRAEADRQGALRTVGDNPLGRVLLLAVAAGFAGYAVWRLVEATVRPGDKGVAGRVAAGAKALLYTGFCVTTASYVVTRHSESANAKQQDWTARVLGWPGGRLIVAAAGTALVVAGLVNAYRALSGKFRKHLKEEELSRNAGRWVAVVAVVGLLARGVAFALVGAFVLQAAIRYDPSRSQGLDGALRKLAAAPYGRPSLLLVAIGLAAFGGWSFIEARYRRVLGT